MIHPETHKVTASNGPRPAGKPDECFYCRASVGADHEVSCVCRTRSVVIAVTFTYAVSVPESWDGSQIESHRNEGSWCASNVMDEIGSLQVDCLCPIVEVAYVREATEDDEETAGLVVGEEEAVS